MVLTAQAQEVNERYVEVTGTSEIEIVPDKIHYIIEIREYFKEEFDGKSKPEEYHTKITIITKIHRSRGCGRTLLKQVLRRMQSVHRRLEITGEKQGAKTFLVSKQIGHYTETSNR